MGLTKLQKTFFLLVVIYLCWEIFVHFWANDVKGAIIRVDLILIYPILLVMLILSIIQQFRRKR